MNIEIRRILTDYALDPSMSSEKAETEILNLLKSYIPTDDKIKELFTTNHYHYDTGHYRKVRLDRIQGAKILRNQILSKL